MKFIRNRQRNAKIREHFLDALSKVLLIGFSVLACLWMISGAHAAQISITDIKTQPAESGAYTIDFTLSERIPRENVAVDFERNFIQVSLRNVSAYPARTETINQSVLEKVFTYQYQPDLARARVLLKTTAAAIKGKASWEITDHGLRVTVKGMPAPGVAKVATDAVKTKAAAHEASEPPSSDTDEERIVKEILSESKGGAKAAPAASAAAATKASEDLPLHAERKPAVEAPAVTTAAGEEQPLFASKGGAAETKAKESPATRIFASLLLVIGLIGACAVGYRRFALGKGISFQKQARVIEVVASQGLGPKRSVALIKVLDQYMVVGMAGDGMNLLANLGADVKIEKFLDQVGGPGSSFNDLFEGAMNTGSPKSDTAGPPIHAPIAKADLGIRSMIKKRMEGFKPL